VQYNIISSGKRRIPRKKILKLLEIIEEDEEPPDSALNVIFIDDRQMARLNRKYRGQAVATDVLSFNIDDTGGEGKIFGEIYISSDTAAKNAGKYNIPFTDEIIRLCCHGFLHLFGYDHERRQDRLIMEAREKHYLERLTT